MLRLICKALAKTWKRWQAKHPADDSWQNRNQRSPRRHFGNRINRMRVVKTKITQKSIVDSKTTSRKWTQRPWKNKQVGGSQKKDCGPHFVFELALIANEEINWHVYEASWPLLSASVWSRFWPFWGTRGSLFGDKKRGCEQFYSCVLVKFMAKMWWPLVVRVVVRLLGSFIIICNCTVSGRVLCVCVQMWFFGRWQVFSVWQRLILQWMNGMASKEKKNCLWSRHGMLISKSKKQDIQPHDLARKVDLPIKHQKTIIPSMFKNTVEIMCSSKASKSLRNPERFNNKTSDISLIISDQIQSQTSYI